MPDVWGLILYRRTKKAVVIMLLQITLTPAEGKRLIAKGVVRMDAVQKALKDGLVIVAQGTTNAYVAEELLRQLGIEYDVDKRRFAAGVITDRPCVVPKAERQAEVIIKKGSLYDGSLEDALEELSRDDVFIKGANAIDPDGVAGILLAHPKGGTIGSALGTVAARGAHFIIPVNLAKSIRFSIVEAARRIRGFQGVYKAVGMPVGLLPVHGTVVTEIEALKLLGAEDAFQIGAGGEGAVVICVEGEREKLDEILEVVTQIKGEPPVKTLTEDCSRCKRAACIYAATKS
ncbi:MAG: hypothetical protein OD814_001673 [Candidatus Alkanophagales archaeon MCA70_species_1]|nr:hypothetical protein [Candidatus Alkanophaga volatiphilum]